jgi:hypothetical protein
MIYLEKEEENSVVFTLNEKTTISNANYFLSLISEGDNTDTILRLSGDTSNNKNRYNQFTLDISLEEELEVGEYDYVVYQSSGTTYTEGLSIVESGKVKIEGEVLSASTYNNNNEEYTFE